MKICSKCNNSCDDAAVFCNNCGNSFSTAQNTGTFNGAQNNNPYGAQNANPYGAQNANPYGAQNGNPYNGGAYTPPPPAYDPYDHTAEFEKSDISENKVLAMIPYLMGWIGIIIALLAVNNSKYVAFQVKQALKLQVCSTLSMFAVIIPFIGWIAAGVCAAIIFVLNIMGFFSVCNGKAKEPAIIKSFGFLR